MATRGLRPTRRGLVLLAFAVAPWTWFLVRDLDARTDIVALFWPVLGVGMVLAFVAVAILGRSWRAALVAASWLLATAVIVVGQWRPLDTGTPVDGVRIAATNIFSSNTYAPGIARQIAAQRPDVLVVSEISPDALTVFGREYDNAARTIEWDTDPSDVVVYTDLPIEYGPLPESLREQRGQRAVIEGPAGPFVLYALHLQKPGPSPSEVEVRFSAHRRIVDALVEAIEDEELPVVVAGDLNLVDRTGGYRALADVLDDGLRSGWVGPTSLKRTTRLLLARIDHVFMPEDWCSTDGETFTMRGSDHRGVATTIGPCER